MKNDRNWKNIKIKTPTDMLQQVKSAAHIFIAVKIHLFFQFLSGYDALIYALWIHMVYILNREEGKYILLFFHLTVFHL